MFLRAGFNGRHANTGIRAVTMHERGNRRGFQPAALCRWASGEYFWHGRNFAAWGTVVHFKNRYEIDDAVRAAVLRAYQSGECEHSWLWYLERDAACKVPE